MKIKPKYFDDFQIGETFETEPNFISKDEIIDFASKYDPQAFHLGEKLVDCLLYTSPSPRDS